MGCENVAASGGSGQGAARPKQYVVMIDISASRPTEMLAESKQFLDHVVQGLTFGDQIVLIQMQQVGLTDHPLRHAFTMPEPQDSAFITVRDRDQLSAEVKSVKSAVPSFFRARNDGGVMHTDILTTVLLADEFVRDGGDRQKVLVLLSDMLQSAKGIEMDGLARMPPHGWIETQKSLGLLPQLGGACVVVVGADATTREGVIVRNFWQAYFTAAGAILTPQNYRATPPTTNPGHCD
jgi:hypothetical protein